MVWYRRKRTAKQKAALAYKQAAPLGIGRSRDETRIAETAAETAQIAATRETVWIRDSTCRLCQGRRDPIRSRDEMHEDPSRAKTRGLPPEQRFNTKICGRLCRVCHRDVTEHEITILFLEPDLGFDGQVVPE